MTISQLAGPGCARRYEKEYINKFRDCLTFYYDGKVHFERFCYGEGACFVFGVWGSYHSADRTILYNEPFDSLVDPSALPRTLTGSEGDFLFFDNARWKWEPVKALENDPENGYTKFKMLIRKFSKK